MGQSAMSVVFAAATKAADKAEVDEVDFDIMKKQCQTNFKFGITLLDALLGGGLKGGKMTEIYGRNKSGKTELCRKLSESWINVADDTYVWYYDQEFALNPDIMLKYPAFEKRDASGQPRFKPYYAANIEGFFATVIAALNAAHANGSDNIKLLIVVDSIKALLAKDDVDETDPNKAVMPKQAKVLSEKIPKLRRLLAKTGAHVVFVNQTRDALNKQPFAEDESPCGQALKFYCDYRFIVKRTGKFSFSKGKLVPKGFKPSGFFTLIKMIKNKMDIPEREVEVPITYMQAAGFPAGASDPWCLFYNLRETNLIATKGGSFTFAGDNQIFDRRGWLEVYKQNLDQNGNVSAGSLLEAAVGKWVDMQKASDISSSGDDED